MSFVSYCMHNRGAVLGGCAQYIYIYMFRREPPPRIDAKWKLQVGGSRAMWRRNILSQNHESR